MGWNVPYEFTTEDFHVSRCQIKELIAYELNSFRLIAFMCVEIIYGGRVTDVHDICLIKCLFNEFVGLNMIQNNTSFSSSHTYNPQSREGLE